MDDNNVISKSKFCQHCGSQVLPEAIMCVKCGCALETDKKTSTKSASRNRVVYAILYWFFAFTGIHEFYAGKSTKGLLWLLALPLCFVFMAVVNASGNAPWVFGVFILLIVPMVGHALIMPIVWLTRNDEDFDKYINS